MPIEFAENPDITEKIPDDWISTPTRKGGWRWQDPDNPSGNNIRIDVGKADVSHTSQQVDHVVIRSVGEGIGKGGVKYESISENWEIAHIPLTEWLTWEYWDKP